MPLSFLASASRAAFQTTSRSLARPYSSISRVSRAGAPSRIAPLVNGTVSQRRYKANQVSNQPASENFTHMAQNIKEEVTGAAADVSHLLAGNGPGLHQDASLRDSFAGVTTSIVKTVPTPVLIWGLAGTLPYLATSLGTIFVARDAMISTASGHAANLEFLHSLQFIQITYGAVILSFLGALHWGMEFAKYGGEHGHSRLLYGVMPILVAWPTLYIPDQSIALIAQWGGFFAMWFADRKAAGWGWTPEWYSTYRFYLTSIVGSSIILSLVGMNWYSPGDIPHHSETSKSPLNQGSSEGTFKSSADVEALPAQEGDDAFVVLHRPAKEKADLEAKKKEKEELEAKQTAKNNEQEASAPKGMKTSIKTQSGNANHTDGPTPY